MMLSFGQKKKGENENQTRKENANEQWNEVSLDNLTLGTGREAVYCVDVEKGT